MVRIDYSLPQNVIDDYELRKSLIQNLFEDIISALDKTDGISKRVTMEKRYSILQLDL